MAARGGPWLGWLGYEAGAWVEPADHWQPSTMASLWAARYDPLIHFELAERRLWLEGEDPGRIETMAALLAALPSTLPVEPRCEGIPMEAWHWHTSEAGFARQVATLRQWIAAGDLFQANLTACCEALLSASPDPLALHGRLRRHCPAPSPPWRWRVRRR